jgi:NAD(P)-dependent dehydrogenase (short-subunit alcohol dehydrogenase family)
MNTQLVLITGGLTGIGRATTLAFAAKGAQVVVSGRRDEEGQKLVSEIRKMGAEAEFVHADVRREGDVRNLIDKTVERYGWLDVAVNAAGTEGVPAGNGTNGRELLGHVRYECTRHAVEHEARTSRDAATKERQHREYILHIRAYRRAWGFCLFRQ